MKTLAKTSRPPAISRTTASSSPPAEMSLSSVARIVSSPFRPRTDAMLIVDRRSDPVPWPASESEALFRQDPREPEVRDHAGIEARQGGDTAARERYHHETRRAEHPTGGV